MKIILVDAFVLKLPRSEAFAGTAGAVPLESDASMVAPSSGAYAPVGTYRSLFSPHVETMMVRIETDSGVVGYGEAQAPIVPEVARLIVDKLFTPMLVGADPFDSQVLWRRMYDGTRERGHGTSFVLDALSAVDIALWDIKGKALGMPVWQLLGGAFRRRVPVYLSGLSATTVEGRVKLAQAYKRDGFAAFKVFLGFSPATDLEIVEVLRAALGNDIDLMVDAHWMYDLPRAVELGGEYERLGIRWLESPLVPEDLAGHADLARQLRLPIAIGEGERTMFQFRQLLESRAADILQPDVGRAGGITESLRIAALADAHHIRVAPHSGVGLAAYIAAGLHLAAAIPNLEILEYQPTMHAIANHLLTEPFKVSQGHVNVPDGPGLGIDFHEKLLERYTVC